MEKVFEGFKLVYVPANTWTGEKEVFELYAPEGMLQTLMRLTHLFRGWRESDGALVADLSFTDHYISPEANAARVGKIFIDSAVIGVTAVSMNREGNLVVEAFGQAETKFADLFPSE